MDQDSKIEVLSPADARLEGRVAGFMCALDLFKVVIQELTEGGKTSYSSEELRLVAEMLSKLAIHAEPPYRKTVESIAHALKAAIHFD